MKAIKACLPCEILISKHTPGLAWLYKLHQTIERVFQHITCTFFRVFDTCIFLFVKLVNRK